jgi:RHS repeat-associated protein
LERPPHFVARMWYTGGMVCSGRHARRGGGRGGVAYEVRQDANLDGVVNASDITHANSITGGYQTLGRGVLSSSGVESRVGYAGYRYEPRLGSTGRHWYPARHRWYMAEVGRWMTRDPLGYVDGMNLYAYVRGRAIAATDPSGLSGICAGGGCGLRAARAQPWPMEPTGPCGIPLPLIPPEPKWGCASASANMASCYDCCNADPHPRGVCYSYCNMRHRPPADWPPFLPGPHSDGPCYRESSGHPTCVESCKRPFDGQMQRHITPNGEEIRICCICDVSHTPAAECSAVAECTQARLGCFVFSDPNVSMECRFATCLGRQVDCLREKTKGAGGNCQEHIRDTLQHWEQELKDWQRRCAGQQSSID